ncbi:hypothetical protein BDZ90DRAFT_31346 [Jaminaea rosea]|uniref:Uncharacterized protein n=1 Tax=Jaminaea rosea TaxID=1569628 RepID=A0A316V188_9BASI|nr:hypothetical protein BDZ90DRAFT_31346 [Jaminaea rosea]PWN31014.1 hypothetical protein BDZ90DRAFT_31346 [Jaminaea rosea]
MYKAGPQGSTLTSRVFASRSSLPSLDPPLLPSQSTSSCESCRCPSPDRSPARTALNASTALASLSRMLSYNIEGFPLPLTTGSACGWLIRFSLLEWDEDRLDRLLLSLRRSMPEGAEARTSRMLLHDGDWVWRLQITLYLGPFLGWQERTFAAAAMSGRHQRARLRPAGLIAAI